MIGLNGRVALVTGGAQGIGAGIARTLVGYGVRVAIVDHQEDKAAELVEAFLANGGSACAVGCDLSSAEGCRTAVEGTVAALGRLDIVVNNAAPGRDRSLVGELSGADWDEHAALVVGAVATLAEQAAPFLAESGSGSIVNLSSTIATSIADDQCTWAYHVSKAGLDQLTRYLACRLGPQNIRVNAVAPGLVDRDSGRRLSDDPEVSRIIRNTVPLRRAASSSDIGETVAFLASDSAAYVTGQVLAVDGGLGVREVFGATLRVTQSD